MEICLLKEEYKKLFGQEAEYSYFSPGRINLIGEHIDYNGGLVFPCAISIGTYGVVGKRNDCLFKVYSMNFESLGTVTFSLDDLNYNADHEWANYIKGVLKTMEEAGHSITFGLNIVINGNIPNGSGLSSSASLEMLACKIFNDYYNLSLSPEDMSLIGKKVENEYIGVNSGIMDQFAIALGKEGEALLLDCNSRNYSYIPFELGNHSIIIMNTNKRRELADSKYNERFGECMEALKILQSHFNINALCELSESNLSEVKTLLNQDVLYKRVKHVITENERVQKATCALKQNDLITFGTLLNASHASLKDDYEVTGIELDTLVSAAQESGALGARMTGAGFGGCAIALVPQDKADELIQKVGQIYESKIGYAASFYVAQTHDGPNQL